MTPERNRFADSFSEFIRGRIERTEFAAIAPLLGWSPPPSMGEIFAAARPYVSEALSGEAVLTVGAPLHEWRHGQIEAVVNVGPLECMPTKIAEAQLQPNAEKEGLLSLTLPFNGDPISEAALDNFAFEVHARFQRRKNGGQPGRPGGVARADERLFKGRSGHREVSSMARRE